MSFSTIARKELSEVERRGWTYLVRGAYVAALALLVANVTGQVWRRDLASIGRDVFVMLAWGQFVLTVALCSTLSGGSIARESRRGSLSLLAVSFLRPLHIVAGKAAACGIAAGATVVATLPLLMMTVLYGGVSMVQVLVAFACLAATLVAGSALGVWSSSRFRNGESAGACTLAALILWLWLLPLVLPQGQLAQMAQLASPWYCFKQGLAVGSGVWPSLGISLWTAACLTVFSLWRASRVISKGVGQSHAQFRMARLDTGRRFGKPWLCCRLFWETSGVSSGAGPLALASYRWVAAAGCAFGLYAYLVDKSYELGACLAIAAMVLAGAGLATMGLCMEAVMRQKTDGSLAVLLTTPVDPARFVRAYLLGAASILLPALVTFEFLLWLWLLSTPRYLSEWFACAMFVAVHACCVLAWCVFYWLVALKASAFCRTQVAAVFNTLLYVLVTGPCAAGSLALGAAGEGFLAIMIAGLIFSLIGIRVLFRRLTAKVRSWHDRM